MPVVLINDIFKKYLINEPFQQRKKIKKQLEFLEIGCWDGSLNMKKVKGTSSNKTIFEARLDRSKRILFTLGKADNFNSAENENSFDENIFVYIWGIVSHDDISLKSKSIFPQNAPFLNFIPYSQSELDNPLFEDLGESCFTQEAITKKVSDDSGSQKWHKLDTAEWQRIEMYTKDDFELFLYMTPQQIQVLKSVPPILLSGTAGSGKTTIGVYYLLKTSLGRYKKLFITYNKFLKNSAERLYNGLINSDKRYSEFLPPQFFTYKEFCLSVAEANNKYFNIDNEVDLEKFMSLIRSSGRQAVNTAKYDIPLIWEEIRSIIKGALPQLNVKLFEFALHKVKADQIDTGLINSLQRQFNIFENLESAGKIEHIVNRFMKMNIPALIKNLNDFSSINIERFQIVIENILELFYKQKELTKKKFLSFLEYEMLGKKKAPNFVIDRKIIYQIFEWYQDKLEQNKLWDELDLTREVINIINERVHGNGGQSKFIYDFVVCDEVQDLTDIQHELLFYLVNNPLDLVLTGDTKQIINPSGFRWEELRQHFYSRNIKVPEVRFLNLNFRSSGSIVELSNSLLEIKTRLLGVSSDQLHEDWKFKSRPPMVVIGIKEPEMIESLTTTGAKKTILVRTETEKKKLKKLLETELIFTIYEAKGLEFDTVLLWKFCADDFSKDLWKNILNSEQISYHQAKIKHEINLLYVAITRAQKDLLIYDGAQASVIWKNQHLADKIFLSDDVDYIDKIWNVISTPEEWLEQGDYFFEREYYKAAIECYKNANAEEQLVKVLAFYNEKHENFLEAAKYFEKHGDVKRAAINYEKSSAFSDALRLWNQLDEKSKIYNLTLKVYEQEGRFSDLAQIYLEQKQYQKAADYFIKDKNFESAAQVFESKLKNKEKAAYYYEAAGKSEKAVVIYMKLKQFEKAALIFENSGDFERAIFCLKKISRKASVKYEQKLIQLYNRTNNFTELIKVYEKKKDASSVLKVLKKNYSQEEIKEQAENLYKSKKYFGAYLRYLAIEDNEKTAECSFLHRNYKEAAKYFELAGNLFSAGKSYEKLRDYHKAFISYIKSEEDKNDNYYKTEFVSKYLTSKEIRNYGQQFYSRDEFDLALQCSNIIMDMINTGVCYYKLNKIDDALKSWGTCFLFDQLEIVASFCLEESRADIFAKLIFDSPLWKFKSSFGSLELYNDSNVVKAMGIYFADTGKQNEDEEFRCLEISMWAQRLILMDIKGKFIIDALNYFENSKKYNDYFKSLVELKSSYEHRRSYSIVYDYFKENKQKFTEVNENSAIALHFISWNNYQSMINKLELNENNFLLFLRAESSEKDSVKEKAYEYLFKNCEDETILLFLRENRNYLRLAQFYESKSDFKRAVNLYIEAKEYTKAVSLCIELGNYLKAGDIYFKIQKYSEALNMYMKHGKNNIKIADTLLKLEEFDRAIMIYKQMGKTNLVKRAMKQRDAKKQLSIESEKPLLKLFDDEQPLIR
jgi:tetratricopeptide (TPR) repeat protein